MGRSPGEAPKYDGRQFRCGPVGGILVGNMDQMWTGQHYSLRSAQLAPRRPYCLRSRAVVTVLAVRVQGEGP